MIQIVEIGSTELEKVLHYYGLLTNADTTFKIICPFHEDVNPSLEVDLSKGTWRCFGCEISGDAYDFVRYINPKESLLKAWVILFRILSSKEVQHIEVKHREKEQKDLKQLYIEAHDYYFGLMSIDWTKPSDLYKKQYQYLKQRGITADTLNKCGAKITFRYNYPVIFPIKDMGKFKGWVCRTTLKRIEKKRKYLYNLGFRRRTTIQGKYDNEQIFLVEGYFDYLKSKQLGITYACAIFGWKITDQQIKKLKKKGVKTIISGLDNDTKGKEGTEYLRKFFIVIPFQYPEGVKDMGEISEEQFKVAQINTNKLKRRKCL